MGQVQSLSTQTEVAASPETVRSVFLDFQRHKEWHHVYTIKCVDPTIQPANLKPGDKLDVDIKGFPFKFQFQPKIIVSSRFELFSNIVNHAHTRKILQTHSNGSEASLFCFPGTIIFTSLIVKIRWVEPRSYRKKISGGSSLL